MSTTRLVRWRRGLLCLLALAGLARVLPFLVHTGRESLQLDYSAFHAAGEAVRRGVTPFRTHFDLDPPIWDGSDTYRHSRFLYPPLVARLFAPLAALPYGLAKRLWMAGSLVALGAALWIVLRASGLRPASEHALLVTGLAALYHPLLTLLERGQIDAVTLLLVAAAWAPWIAGRERALLTGVLLALATLLKLNVVYLLPFFVLQRRVRALAAYLGAGLVLAFISVAVDGRTAVVEYATRELPRIAQYGEDGTAEMRLPEEVLERLRGKVPAGFTMRDGRQYRTETLGFVANASLGRVVAKRLQTTPARASLIVLAAATVLLAAGVRFGASRKVSPRGTLADGVDRLAYASAAMTAVLLAGPLTWAMNTVWLLPVIVFLIRARESRGMRRVAWALALAGFVIAALPDRHATEALWTWLRPAQGDLKYVLAEGLCFLGLCLWLGAPPRTPRSDRPARAAAVRAAA